MKHAFLTLLTLVFLTLACTVSVPNAKPALPTPTETLFPTPTAPALVALGTPEASVRTATVKQVLVNVRDEPDGEPIGYLRSGDTVTVLRCLTIEPWCKIERPENAKWKLAYGWIYAGCLDIDSGRKCEQKP